MKLFCNVESTDHALCVGVGWWVMQMLNVHAMIVQLLVVCQAHPKLVRFVAAVCKGVGFDQLTLVLFKHILFMNKRSPCSFQRDKSPLLER